VRRGQPSNAWFFGPQIHNPNDMSIGLAVIPGLMIMSDRPTNRQTDKLVGFYGPLRPQFRTPPVPNVPSSECPPASIAARRCAAGSIRISGRASGCCSSAIAGITIGAKFKMYLFRQFCSNRVEFCYNTQETQTQKKMMDPNFEIRIL